MIPAVLTAVFLIIFSRLKLEIDKLLRIKTHAVFTADKDQDNQSDHNAPAKPKVLLHQKNVQRHLFPVSDQVHQTQHADRHKQYIHLRPIQSQRKDFSVKQYPGRRPHPDSPNVL